MADHIVIEDIIEEIPNVAEEQSEEEGEFSFAEMEYDSEGTEVSEAGDEIDEDGFIHIGDTSAGDIERIVDVLGGIFVNADGETVCDVLTNLNENIDRHNKILYRISQDLRALASKK